MFQYIMYGIILACAIGILIIEHGREKNKNK